MSSVITVSVTVFIAAALALIFSGDDANGIDDCEGYLFSAVKKYDHGTINRQEFDTKFQRYTKECH